MLNRTIDLNTSVSILNNIIDKHFLGHNLIENGQKVGKVSIYVELTKKSKKELGYLIFDEDDLETYIESNAAKDRKSLDIDKLWKMIENKYGKKITYVTESRKFYVAK